MIIILSTDPNTSGFNVLSLFLLCSSKEFPLASAHGTHIIMAEEISEVRDATTNAFSLFQTSKLRPHNWHKRKTLIENQLRETLSRNFQMPPKEAQRFQMEGWGKSLPILDELS